jgi:hypothetical protein
LPTDSIAHSSQHMVLTRHIEAAPNTGAGKNFDEPLISQISPTISPATTFHASSADAAVKTKSAQLNTTAVLGALITSKFSARNLGAQLLLNTPSARVDADTNINTAIAETLIPENNSTSSNSAPKTASTASNDLCLTASQLRTSDYSLPSSTSTPPASSLGVSRALVDMLHSFATTSDSLSMQPMRIVHTNMCLNPPGLGTVEVGLRMHLGIVQLVVRCQQSDTVEALRAEAPLLRQALAGSGLILDDYQIEAHPSSTTDSSSDHEDSPNHDSSATVATVASVG